MASLQQVTVSLRHQQDVMYRSLSHYPHEMILGRNVFPWLEYDVRHLNPRKLYKMMLHFEVSSETRFIHDGKTWIPSRAAVAHRQPKKISHTNGVRNGKFWMTTYVTFNFVRVVKYLQAASESEAPLRSYHKYCPVLTIIECPTAETISLPSVSYRVPYTEFIAVHKFHNTVVNELKQRNKPGFKLRTKIRKEQENSIPMQAVATFNIHENRMIYPEEEPVEAKKISKMQSIGIKKNMGAKVGKISKPAKVQKKPKPRSKKDAKSIQPTNYANPIFLQYPARAATLQKNLRGELKPNNFILPSIEYFNQLQNPLAMESNQIENRKNSLPGHPNSSVYTETPAYFPQQPGTVKEPRYFAPERLPPSSNTTHNYRLASFKSPGALWYQTRPRMLPQEIFIAPSFFPSNSPTSNLQDMQGFTNYGLAEISVHSERDSLGSNQVPIETPPPVLTPNNFFLSPQHSPRTIPTLSANFKSPATMSGSDTCSSEILIETRSTIPNTNTKPLTFAHHVPIGPLDAQPIHTSATPLQRMISMVEQQASQNHGSELRKPSDPSKDSTNMFKLTCNPVVISPDLGLIGKPIVSAHLLLAGTVQQTGAPHIPTPPTVTLSNGFQFPSLNSQTTLVSPIVSNIHEENNENGTRAPPAATSLRHAENPGLLTSNLTVDAVEPLNSAVPLQPQHVNVKPQNFITPVAVSNVYTQSSFSNSSNQTPDSIGASSVPPIPLIAPVPVYPNAHFFEKYAPMTPNDPSLCNHGAPSDVSAHMFNSSHPVNTVNLPRRPIPFYPPGFASKFHSAVQPNKHYNNSALSPHHSPFPVGNTPHLKMDHTDDSAASLDFEMRKNLINTLSSYS